MAAPSLEARVKSVLVDQLRRARACAAWMPSRSSGWARLPRWRWPFVRPGHRAAVAGGRPLLAPVAPATLVLRHAAPSCRAGTGCIRNVAGAGPCITTITSRSTLDGDRLTHADKARIDAAVAQVRATMAGVRPQIERACNRLVPTGLAMRCSRDAAGPCRHRAGHGQIRPALHQAFADERVDAKVGRARPGQAQIDAAMDQASRTRSGRICQSCWTCPGRHRCRIQRDA